MRASIIIAAHNEGNRVVNTVRSTVETSGELDCEIVLADDASTDGSIEEIARQFPQVRIVGQPERRGGPSNKHHGAECARGDVLVFLDGHCKPEADAIARLVDGIDTLGGTALVMPRVPTLDVERWKNDLVKLGQGYRLDLETFASEWIHTQELRRYAQCSERVFYLQPALNGCCFGISRELYKSLGGFDTGMKMWGVEDLDLGLRAWLSGHPIVQDPEAYIGHRFQTEFSYSVPLEHVVANALRMARKNFDDERGGTGLNGIAKGDPNGLGTPPGAFSRKAEPVLSAHVITCGHAAFMMNKAFGSVLVTSGATPNPFRYIGRAGYLYSTDLARYYVRERTYDPTLARWLSADPLGDVDTPNRYVYVRSNPLKLIDPSGLQGCKVKPIPTPPEWVKRCTEDCKKRGLSFLTSKTFQVACAVLGGRICWGYKITFCFCLDECMHGVLWCRWGANLPAGDPGKKYWPANFAQCEKCYQECKSGKGKWPMTKCPLDGKNGPRFDDDDPPTLPDDWELPPYAEGGGGITH
jgi:RHS repeat-associated protein